MVQVHGEEKAAQINAQKPLAKENYIRKYGKEEGTYLWKMLCDKYTIGYSEVSQELFRNIDALIGDKHETYFATKNDGEYEIFLENGKYVFILFH